MVVSAKPKLGRPPAKPVITKTKFAPTSYKQALFMNSESFMCVFGGAAGCFDATAEYLSEDGWKAISEYDGGKVTQWDATTNVASLVQPEEYIKLPCKTFTRMQAKGLDFILSDEHRVPYFNDHDLFKPKVLSWSEVKERHLKSKSKGWTGKIKTTFNVDNVGIPLTDNEIRLQVAIQADGQVKHESKDGWKSILVRVSKDRKADRLKALLEDLGVDYTYKFGEVERYSNGHLHHFYFRDDYGTKLFDRSWYQCSQEQLAIVVEECQYWDGTIYKYSDEKVSFKYFSNIKENVDFIQYASHACGYNTNIHYSGHCYELSCHTNGKGFRSFVGKGYKQEITEFPSTDGNKYCFVVPSTFLLMRQNGKIFISGNSGKTYTSLMRFLRYVKDPDFVGYVFRTNATDLKKQGGAFPTAVKMFTAYDPRVTYTQQPMVIKFPSGATISFTGMDDEAGRKAIQGIEISAAMVDEAANMLEEDVWWIISRLRTNADMKPNIWLTCNPDASSFLLDWIDDYYLYPRGTIIDGELVEGRPDPDRNGDERFYLRIGNDLVWGNTAEELYNAHHSKFIKDPQTGKSTCIPKSFRFIGATCFDNPEMLKKNPEYVSSLASLGRVTMERLLKGSWYAREEASGYYKRDWLTELDPRNKEDMSYLKEVTSRCRAWDIAGTIPSEANPDPDWTVGVLIARTRDGRFIIEDVKRDRRRSGDNLKWIIEVAKEDRKMFGNQVKTILPQDPAEAGKAIRQVRAQEFASHGIPVKFEKIAGNKSKLDKFTPLSSACENGCVYYIKADWNNEYHRELENFDGVSRRYHDDQVDSSATSYNFLATTKEYRKLNASLIG